MATTMFQAVVLGLFVVSGALADVVHLQNVKQCYKKHTQNTNYNGNFVSTSGDHSNVAYSHQNKTPQHSTPATPAPLIYNAQSSTPEDLLKSNASLYSLSTPASFEIESQSIPASFGIESQSSPASFGINSQSTPVSSSPVVSIMSYGTVGSQPTSAPFKNSTLPSTPAPFQYTASSTTPENPFISTAASYAQSTPAPFAIESQSTAVPFAFSGLSSGPAAAVSVNSFNTFGSNPINAPYSYSQGTTFAQYGGHSAPSPAHEITINREIPVPYYVQIEKRIPYPVLVHVPHPYPVTVEKLVPYAVRVHVDRAVPVPSPYPVEVEKRVPYPVEKPVRYAVRVPVDRPYPVSVPYEKPVPYAVEKPVPYPVRVNVDRPYPVEKPVPYPVAVERPVPYAVEKPVPYPVEKPVPYPVEKRIPYPVKYEVPVNVPVPVQVKVPVNVDRPVPYPVEKRVPYPVAVPYEVKVPVPVRSPAQHFATVNYYQQSPIVVQQESYKPYTSGSTAAPVTNNHLVQSSFVSGSGQAGSNYAGPVYTISNYAESGLVQDSGLYGFGQQSFYGSTTPVPSLTTGYTASSSLPQYESSGFDSIAQQVGSIAGSVKTGSDYAGSDFTKSNYAPGQTQSDSYGFGQQSFYGSKTPVPSSLPQSESSNIDSSNQEVVSVGGSRKTESDNAGSDYTGSNYAESGQAQNSASYSFNQQSKTPVSSTKSSSLPQNESFNFDSVNQQVDSVGGSAAADSQQTENLEVGKK